MREVIRNNRKGKLKLTENETALIPKRSKNLLIIIRFINN